MLVGPKFVYLKFKTLVFSQVKHSLFYVYVFFFVHLVASDDEGNYLFNALMDRYNRGESEKPPTVETVLHGMKTSDSLTDILGGFLSSIDNGQKVAARGADTQSEGSSGVGTTMLVVGVILALMLLVGVGFYVYKR